jgi:hypothetical protein
MQMKGKVNVNDDAGLEREADVMGRKAFQRRMIGDSTEYNSLTYTQKGIVQRVTYVKEPGGNTKYKNREYKREKGGKETDDGVGMGDEKMQILHEFALALNDELKARNNSTRSKKYSSGPHIAVSVQKKVLYVAVNTKGPNDAKLPMVPKNILEDITHELVRKWRGLLPDEENKAHDSKYTHAIRWLVSAAEKKIEVFGADDKDKGIMHGEMRILKHMHEKNILDTIRKQNRGKDGYKKVIRIGGTQLDCSDCHQAEHGGHGHGHSHGNKDSLYGVATRTKRKSYDELFSKKGYMILSPGTHGKSYPGWRDPQTDSPLNAPEGSTGDYKPKLVLNKTKEIEKLVVRKGKEKESNQNAIAFAEFIEKNQISHEIDQLSVEVKAMVFDNTKTEVKFKYQPNDLEGRLHKLKKALNDIDQTLTLTLKTKIESLLERTKSFNKRKTPIEKSKKNKRSRKKIK